jgi:hypothetical protein
MKNTEIFGLLFKITVKFCPFLTRFHPNSINAERQLANRVSGLLVQNCFTSFNAEKLIT